MRQLSTAVAVALLIAGCGAPSRTADASPFRMRVASYYWPGMHWADVAKEKGFFAEAGLDVELVDASGDYIGSLDWLMGGKVDAHLFNIYDVLHRCASGSGLQLVLLSDTTSGADVLVARTPIRDVPSLRGKRIGLVKGTFQEAVLSAALESGGLELKDVTLVGWSGDPVPAPDAPLDALVTWEPLATQAVAAGGWSRLFDTSQFRGGLPYGYVFRREFVTRNPGAVQRFVQVWDRASKYVRAHPQEAYAIVARKYRTTPAEVAAFAKLDVVYDRDDNIRAFAYGAGPVSVHNTARRMSRLLIEQGHATRMIDSTAVIEPRFVRALAAGEE